MKKIEEQNNCVGSIESIDTNRVMHKNDGINGVIAEGKSIIIYQRKKRQKKTELSDRPKSYVENNGEAASSSLCLPHRVGCTSSEGTSVKRVIARDVISGDVTSNESLEQDLDHGFSFCDAFSDNDRRVLIGKSNGNTSESCNANIPALKLHRTYQTDNHELPRVASDDAHCRDFPRHSDIKERSSNGATTINTNSCDDDMLAVNLLKEHRSEADENVSSVKVHVDFEEENIGNPKSDEKVVNESINVATHRASAGYTGKKLLVVDVNGLLVDINSYVPYDYDPDDIIMKKAVFKRPYCDDFLRFCFERFNVGVWSSRTKRNMEPILDFLLGKDKCKLLFSWDQSHCTNTGFYTIEKRYKPLLLKKLKKLWDKCEPDLPWERGLYNESNTLLLDDSPYKALSNPRFTAIFPHTYRFRKLGDNSLGPGGDIRTYLEGLAIAENVQEYVKQNPFGQRAITETNLSWRYYIKVIEASTTPPRQTDEDDSSQLVVQNCHPQKTIFLS